MCAIPLGGCVAAFDFFRLEAITYLIIEGMEMDVTKYQRTGGDKRVGFDLAAFADLRLIKSL
jgi:hypothetical protein